MQEMGVPSISLPREINTFDSDIFNAYNWSMSNTENIKTFRVNFHSILKIVPQKCGLICKICVIYKGS